jgi:hypothetical protein
MTTIAERFERIPFHDAELLEVRIASDAQGQNVLGLTIRLADAADRSGKQRIEFVDPTYIQSALDLAAKTACSDMILSGKCYVDSPLKATLERTVLASEKAPLSEFLHFAIILCPTSGELHVFARDFVVKTDE